MKTLDEICTDVEAEYGMGGLSFGLYADYAKDVAKRYAAALEQEQEAVGPALSKEGAAAWKEAIETVKALYFAAYWHPDRECNAADLWGAVRDAVGIKAGQTAAVLGEDRAALASPVATREDVIRECIAVAEALPPMRKISDAHVKATSPKDVAVALSTLLEGGR